MLCFSWNTASDLRLGQQAMTVACNFDKVFAVTERTYLGLAGLASDVATLKETFRYRVNMYKMKEEREIQPETFAHLVSSTLYEKRWVIPSGLSSRALVQRAHHRSPFLLYRFGPYFIEPVICGLSSPDAPVPNEPFIAASDLIGCLNFAKDFVVSGTAR